MENVIAYEDQLDDVLASLRATILAKHHDYGSKNLLEFGEYGVLVRASDKVARLKNLLENGDPKVEEEKLADTWMDLAGYAIQALALFYGEEESPEDILEEMAVEDLFNAIMGEIEGEDEPGKKPGELGPDCYFCFQL